MSQFTSGVAPSCAPSAGMLALAVASTPALNGFVTIVPDATSYGKAPYGAYLEGTVAGHAALNAARAAFHTTQALGQPIARKAVVAGMSQGAFSTMAAATAYPTYANQLEIRGFLAAEPPSNLAGTLADDFNASTQPSMVFDAMRLWSWQGLLGLNGGAIFQPPYDTKAPAWFESECVYGSDGSGGTLENEFLEPAGDGGAPTPLSITDLFTPAFIQYAQQNAWPADWAAEYAASSNVPSGLALPVLVFEGTNDATVPPRDVDAYVAQLQAAGVNVDYRKILGGTHATTAMSSFTVQQAASDQAVAWITATLAN